jgi:hypothetical protein
MPAREAPAVAKRPRRRQAASNRRQFPKAASSEVARGRMPARGRAASGSAATTAPRRLCASEAPHRDGARQHRRTPAPARVSDGSMQDETRRKGLFWRLDAAGKGIPAPRSTLTDRRPGKAARRKPRPELSGAARLPVCADSPSPIAVQMERHSVTKTKGESHVRSKRLFEAGLRAPSSSAYHLPPPFWGLRNRPC